jgi:hypothetical protein
MWLKYIYSVLPTGIQICFIRSPWSHTHYTVRFNVSNDSVRIRVRIDPPHPLVCRKRRLNGAVLRMRPEKTEVPCHSRCGTIKIPPCSKALSAEHTPKFCSPSLVMVTTLYHRLIHSRVWERNERQLCKGDWMVTSPYKWKILERDVKP